MLKQYIRSRNSNSFVKKGSKVGLMLAIVQDGKIKIGWSAWNFKKDSYDRRVAEETALIRLRGDFDPNERLAFRAKNELPKFIERAQKFYKGMGLDRKIVKLQKKHLGKKSWLEKLLG